MSLYRTIVADPPWPQKAGGPLTGRKGFLDTADSLPMPYRTMTVAEIAALVVPAADDAELYLWTTSRFLEDAYAVVRAWGFRYSTTLVWAKAPIGSGLGGKFGIATEFILFARRGHPSRDRRIGRNWFTWKRPYDERGKPRHSAKPPEFYAMVEQVSPGPFLEMFARDFRLGWDSWGDEAPNRDGSSSDRRAELLSAIRAAARTSTPPEGPEVRAPYLYYGQHADCISTIPHYHDRPYRLGDWAASPAPDPGAGLADIRATHRAAFRSGEWARLTGVEWWGLGRPCFTVRFPDGVTDSWAVYDPLDPYEFRVVPSAEPPETT